MVQMISESKRKIAALALAGAMAIGGAAGVATTIASPAQNQSGIVMEAEAATVRVNISGVSGSTESYKDCFIKFKYCTPILLIGTKNNFDPKIEVGSAAYKDPKLISVISGNTNVVEVSSTQTNTTILTKKSGSTTITYTFQVTNVSTGEKKKFTVHKKINVYVGTIRVAEQRLKVGATIFPTSIPFSIKAIDSSGSVVKDLTSLYKSKVKLEPRASSKNSAYAAVYDNARDWCTIKGIKAGEVGVTLYCFSIVNNAGTGASCTPNFVIYK